MLSFIRDAFGYTPFMFAVAHRAYPVALVLFHAAFNITMDGKSQEKDINIIIG